MPNRFQDRRSECFFWLLIAICWLFSTLIDRIWWNLFSDVPAWDQADYLNSALEHGRALNLLPGGGWIDLQSFFDLSPKENLLTSAQILTEAVKTLTDPVKIFSVSV